MDATPDLIPHMAVGDLIRYWRTSRGLSQMRLAHEIGISPRHMSFVETGRSRPSQPVVVRIAERLRVPGREENVMLEAAGYARRHRESSLGAPELDHVRSVLAFLLERHEPHSALVFDRNWDIVMHNEAHGRILEALLGPGGGEGIRDNLLRLTFHPEGLRPLIVNLGTVSRVLLARLDRELADAPSAHALRDLREELHGFGPAGPDGPSDTPNPLLLPVHLRKGGLDLRLFSVVSTIGSATDLTLQELRLESFFPADEESRAALEAFSDTSS